MRISIVLIVAVASTVAATGCGSAGAGAVPAAVPVATHRTIQGSGVDSLDPPPAGMTFSRSVSDVLAAARKSPYVARYLADSSKLTVEAGSYTNPALQGSNGQPMKNEPVYVIVGGQAACAPAGGRPPEPGAAPPSPSSGTCTATIVVSATSASLLFIVEKGNGGSSVKLPTASRPPASGGQRSGCSYGRC